MIIRIDRPIPGLAFGDLLGKRESSGHRADEPLLSWRYADCEHLLSILVVDLSKRDGAHGWGSRGSR